MGTGRDLIHALMLSGSESPDGEIEIHSLLHNRWIPAHSFIPPEHIAVHAPGAYPGASVPQIPVGGHGTPGIGIIFGEQ